MTTQSVLTVAITLIGIALASQMSQETDITLSDSDLSESSEGALCIDLGDREVQEYAKLKGGQVKKAFKREIAS